MKLYIGQAKNVENRWHEHCLNASNIKHTEYLYQSMRKYGINNFKIEIIEGPISNYNEREKYWIAYYNTYLDKTKGYNMTPGGEEPPIIKGEDSSLSSYSNEQIANVQQALIDNVLSFQEISEKYDISVNYLSLINRGITRHNNNFSYPLRSHTNQRKDEEIINSISFYLLYTTNSIEQISKLLNINSNTIYKVNKGEHFYSNPDLSYPIRQPFSRVSTYLLKCIYEDLLDNKLKLSDIEKKYNLSKSTINRINQGKLYKQENFSYPLRSSDRRVYN